MSLSVHLVRNAVRLAPALTILVDRRETASGIEDALAALGVEVRITSLPVADYMVARRVGVERKRVRDLHRSIANGRLWTQVASLRVDLDTAYLLVEGDDLDRGCVSAPGVRGALLEVMRLGLHVVRSTDVPDSAQWLTRIAARAARPKPPGLARRARPRVPTTPRSILADIPGISPRLADTLLERFGSIAGVAAASRSDLLAIRGLGPNRVTALHRLLTESSNRR